MANYEVRYDVQVTTGNSVSALRQFEQAVAPLTTAASTLDVLSRKISSFNKAVGNISTKPITINMNVAPGLEAKLDGILAKLKAIRTASKGALSGSLSSGTSQRTSSQSYSSPRPANTSGVAYRAFGATPFMGSNVAAIDFLKGMGIAYGIAGAGQLVSSIVKQSAEYDNTMQTAKNILKAHDNRQDFSSRFREMETIIRRVGIETKFTAPEVADASRFLAMAGLKVEDIKEAIRPIADIALIGDTELGETADVVTNIMTAYRKPSSQMRNIADVLTNTFTMSNTTLMEMAEAYKYSASLLSAGDVDFEESAAALGVLGDAGIKGSQAGTTMRTIMANIVNPTKKQKAAWAAYGLDTSSGSLIDIFRQINAKDLPVQAFYQLFHKTAAQGAVALANSVEKWADIYKENLFAQDISKEQANAKKNTLQGLWASLMSAFTDDGMSAFEEIKSTLRAYLKLGTDWLMKDSTKEAFKDYTHQLVGFIDTLKTAIGHMVNLFKQFGGAIKMYLKFQLFLWPFINGIKALMGLMNGVKWMLALPRIGSSWLGGFGFSNAKLMPGGRMGNGSTARRPYYFAGEHNIREKIGMWFSGGMMPMRDYFGKYWNFTMNDKQLAGARQRMTRDYIMRTTGRDIGNRSEDFARRYMNMYHPVYASVMDKNVAAMTEEEKRRLEKQHQNRLKPLKNQYVAMRGLSTLGNVGMGFGSGFAIGAATDWSPTGTLMGTLTAMGGLLSWGGWTGPIAAGLVAIAGISFAIKRHIDIIREACDSIDLYASKIRTFNGVMVGEGASPLNLALEMAYNKNLSINQLLAEQYEYYKKINNIKDDKTDLNTDAEVDQAAYKGLLEKYEKGRSIWAGDHVYSDVLDSVLKADAKLWGDEKSPLSVYKLNNTLGYTQMGPAYYYDALNDRRIRLYDPNGGTTRSDIAMLMAGAHVSAAEELVKIQADYTNKAKYIFYNGMNDSALTEMMDDYKSKYSPEALRAAVKEDFTNVENLDFDELKNNNGEWQKHTLPFLNYLHTHLNGDDSIINTRFKFIQDYLNIREKGGSLDMMSALNMWQAMDPALFQGDAKLYIPNDWFATLKNFGYDATTGVVSLTDDINKRTFERISNMLKLFPNLPPELQSAMSEWKTKWDLVIRFFQASTYDATRDGAYELLDPTKQGLIQVGGESFMWDAKNNVWRAGMNSLNMNDDPTKYMAVQNENLSIQKKLADDKKLILANAGQTDGDTSSPWSSGTHTPSGSSLDYKNHYKNQASAPKQIIINIDNMMNVESIDLSKADNQAAVNNIKEQLAQALIDVVHDFSISSGHLG